MKEVSLRCLLLINVLIFLTSCEDKKKKEEAEGTVQLRLALLSNIADNLISPDVDLWKQESDDFYALVQEFNTSPNVTKLKELKSKWESSYLQFIKINHFDMTQLKVVPNNELGRVLGAFPVNRNLVENRIKDGLYSTNNFSFSTRGYNVIEYLLFGHNLTEQEVVDQFTNSSNRKIYLDSISKNIVLSANKFKSLWSAYKPSFVSDGSRSEQSSISELAKSYVFAYEQTKNFRLQAPLGLRPGMTSTYPDSVDAYYSGKSLKAIQTSLEYTYAIWKGKTKSLTDSTGFDDYLEGISSSGKDLAADARTSWNQVFSSFDEIPNDQTMTNLIANNNSKLSDFETKIREHTPYLKSQFISVTGIRFSIASGDND